MIATITLACYFLVSPKKSGQAASSQVKGIPLVKPPACPELRLGGCAIQKLFYEYETTPTNQHRAENFDTKKGKGVIEIWIPVEE
ncbi:hypothetical protein [Rhodohalobacter sp. SW132]|uniref:hypothetical protein n=1 Tax=Rhodohalobacter sp. SW132 TaxID=2293433 RepID=UPI0011C03336|nr:hypothetical protein [Rhodohalobacter sp. SW132]